MDIEELEEYKVGIVKEGEIYSIKPPAEWDGVIYVVPFDKFPGK